MLACGGAGAALAWRATAQAGVWLGAVTALAAFVTVAAAAFVVLARLDAARARRRPAPAASAPRMRDRRRNARD